MKFLADRKEFPSPFNDEAFFGIELLIRFEEDFEGSIEHDRPENIHQESETVHQLYSGKDHYSAQDDDADNSIVQDSALLPRCDLEIGEEHQEDKKIIYRKRLFNNISRKKSQGMFMTVWDCQPDNEGGDKGDAYPK